MAEADLLQHVREQSPALAPGSADERLFVEGETCWRLLRVHRVAFLIDAAAYFSAFKAAAPSMTRCTWLCAKGVETPEVKSDMDVRRLTCTRR